ncbi:MAG: AraC family transcriptional regulator [Blautia marasmi]
MSAHFLKSIRAEYQRHHSRPADRGCCQYLKSSNLSLKEISIRCGYANQYYFSNSFKENRNVTLRIQRAAFRYIKNNS